MTLAGVADEIQHRIIHLVARDANGERATYGGSDRMNHDPHFRDCQSLVFSDHKADQRC